MKWISIAVLNEGESFHPAIYAVNEKGDIWYYFPVSAAWSRLRNPSEEEISNAPTS